MIFNSLQFIFVFLPVSLAGYYALMKYGQQRWVFPFLMLVSLSFYAAWNLPYVLLLVASVVGNHVIGRWIERYRSDETARARFRILVLGVILNLAVLGWYKYANFFVNNLNALGADFHLQRIILPIGISFYTFQQIAYLVDLARGHVVDGGFRRYATFVIFFPQLIAGPIVRYNETVPQFFGRNAGRFATANVVVGLTIFAIGLFKKTVIADTAGLYADPYFAAALAGQPVSLLAGWAAALTYTVQLYFDFSGYSDMAVGVARMFGIRFPPNFHSPLRAASIIEYWRRWHITLQRFIVSYMHQPLVFPLSRFAAEKGLGKWPTFLVASALPTVVVFTVLGLWHGPAWTFVYFGLMHGAYLATNEAWRTLRRKSRRKKSIPWWAMLFYHSLTLAAVMFANVMFRAETPDTALAIWSGMVSVDQWRNLPQALPFQVSELLTEPGLLLLVAVALVFLFPNTQQILRRYNPVLYWSEWRDEAPSRVRLLWRPNLLWAVWTGVALFLGIAFILRGEAKFIYQGF